MIKPAHVSSMHRSVSLYEKVIDAQLEAPWPEAIQKSGRQIFLRIPSKLAIEARQPSTPSKLQEDILYNMYTSNGWTIKRTGGKDGDAEWLVQFPAEKA